MTVYFWSPPLESSGAGVGPTDVVYNPDRELVFFSFASWLLTSFHIEAGCIVAVLLCELGELQFGVLATQFGVKPQFRFI